MPFLGCSITVKPVVCSLTRLRSITVFQKEVRSVLFLHFLVLKHLGFCFGFAHERLLLLLQKHLASLKSHVVVRGLENRIYLMWFGICLVWCVGSDSSCSSWESLEYTGAVSRISCSDLDLAAEWQVCKIQIILNMTIILHQPLVFKRETYAVKRML